MSRRQGSRYDSKAAINPMQVGTANAPGMGAQQGQNASLVANESLVPTVSLANDQCELRTKSDTCATAGWHFKNVT